jgi:hypothetical protein
MVTDPRPGVKIAGGLTVRASRATLGDVAAKRCCVLCGGVLDEALYCAPCRYRVESWYVVLHGRVVAVGHREGGLGVVVEDRFLRGLEGLADWAEARAAARAAMVAVPHWRARSARGSRGEPE